MKPSLFLALPLLLMGCPHSGYYKDGAGLEAQLDREIQALRSQVRELEGELESCDVQGEPDRMYADLHQVFAGTEVVVERAGNATKVIIPGDHLFRAGTTDTRQEANMTLDLLATAVNIHDKHQVVIEGHTDDSMPTGELARYYRSNWEVSFARAKAVMEVLTKSYGVSESRISLVARGEFDPVASNDVSSGKAQNRRIVIYIYPPGGRR